MVSNTSRAFEGVGEIYDMNGTLLASASAIYIKLPLNKIATTSHEDIDVIIPCDRDEI